MSRDRCAQHRDLVFLLWQELGWIGILEKSELIPPKVFAFVGICYNQISLSTLLTLENCIKVIQAEQLSSKNFPSFCY